MGYQLNTLENEDITKLTLQISCIWCKTKHDIVVNKTEYDAWQAGGLIQNTFPYLSASDREILISGTCGSCFDDMM